MNNKIKVFREGKKLNYDTLNENDKDGLLVIISCDSGHDSNKEQVKIGNNCILYFKGYHSTYTKYIVGNNCIVLNRHAGLIKTDNNCKIKAYTLYITDDIMLPNFKSCLFNFGNFNLGYNCDLDIIKGAYKIINNKGNYIDINKPKSIKYTPKQKFYIDKEGNSHYDNPIVDIKYKKSLNQRS